MHTEEPKHDLSSTWTGDDGSAYLPISLVVLLRRSIWISGTAHSKKPGTATVRHSGWRNGFTQFQIWIHFVYRSHFLTASAVPRCLRAWSGWLQSTRSRSREGNVPLKDEFPHMSKFRRKPSNRAPACNSQPVFICAEEEGGRGRQASQSASILRSFCVSTQRGARCVCGAVAGWLRHTLFFCVHSDRHVDKRLNSNAACRLTTCYIPVGCQKDDLAAKVPLGSSQCPLRREWR